MDDSTVLSPTAVQQNSAPTLPSPHKDINDCTIDIDDVSSSDFCSSDDSEDDDGGVFFGKHSEAESRFLANVSRPTPLPSPSPPSKGSRRQSRLVSRLRKDSTEFSRRKTMLHLPVPVEEDEEQEEQDMQERYQRDISVLQISPSVLGTGHIRSPKSPSRSMRTAINHLGLGGSPSQDANSESDSSSTIDSNDYSVDSSNANADSDKENVQCAESPVSGRGLGHEVRMLGTSGSTAQPGEVTTEYSVCISQHEDFAEVFGLDMGGLRLDDFSEGAAGPVAAPVEDDVTAYESDDSLEPSPVSAMSPTAAHTGHEVDQSSPSSLASLLGATPAAVEAAAVSLSALNLTIAPTTVGTEYPSNEVSEGDSELEDLPVSRAGPSVNVFASFSPIRGLASPYRSPPPLQNDSMGATIISPPSRFALPIPPEEEASLQSPTRPSSQIITETPLAARTPRQLGPLPTTATPSRAREELVPLVDRGTKILKSQTAIALNASQQETSLIPTKDRNRALAVRGKLNAGFASRPGMMGPPQRSVSATSSLSSSGSKGEPTTQAVTGRLASKKVDRPTGLPARPASSTSRLPPVSTLGKGPQVSSFRTGTQQKSLSSSLSTRPVSALSMTSAAATRPALAPRSLVTHPPKQPISRPVTTKSARSMMTMPSAKIATVPQAVPVAVAKNPLKRPFPISAPAPSSRQAITTSAGPRPALGLPSRLVWDAGQARPTPVFHIGAAPPQTHMAQIAMKSPARQAAAQRAPGTPSTSRTANIGTPSRPNGTPRTIRAKASFQMMSLAAKPAQDVSEVAEPTSLGPPASSTRQASEHQVSPVKSHDDQHRGSSADHEDVSMQLARPPSSQPSSASPPARAESPKKKVSPVARKPESFRTAVEEQAPGSPSGSRPKRTAAPPSSRGRSTVHNKPAAPWMSGKELKTTTDRNTMRNQVYLCAIDRQIVHVAGPRPPSPTSKIRTTADRDEEEKKKSREHRAKRRGASGQEGSPERPIIEKVARARGPGDEEDWITPARPAKKAKLGMDKSVKWDRELVIIRDDGTGVCPPASEMSEEPKRSCVRSKVELDKHGNLVSTGRPKEELKRSKVVVTAVFYEGEEPVPAPEHAPAPVEETADSSKGSGKRKK